jgi:Protein of unknown function (DUF3551)
MRLVLPALLLLTLANLATLAFAPASPAQADPYKWCADYRGRGGGGTNCYFSTFEQCQASISGVGGFCRVNGFYDGKPVRTPEDGYAYRPRHKKHRG